MSLTQSTPETGYYYFEYQLNDYYSDVKVHVEIYTWDPIMEKYGYYNIEGSPITVSIGILDMDLYESYEDLSVGGFGVSYLSFIQSITNPIIAGIPWQLKIDPRNQYN